MNENGEQNAGVPVIVDMEKIIDAYEALKIARKRQPVIKIPLPMKRIKFEDKREVKNNESYKLENGILTINEARTQQKYEFMNNEKILKFVVGENVGFDNPFWQCVSEGRFKGCINLQCFDFTGVEEISKYAFAGCKKLTLKADDLIELLTIGDSAFEGCEAIEGRLNFNGEVKIGANAFKDTNLREVYIVGETDAEKKAEIVEAFKDFEDLSFYFSNNCWGLRAILDRKLLSYNAIVGRIKLYYREGGEYKKYNIK